MMMFCALWIAFLSHMLAGADGQRDKIREINYTVLEEQEPNTFVCNISQDPRFPTKAHGKDVSYKYLSNGDSYHRYFTLSAETGEIRTAQRIDRESICANLVSCRLTLEVVIQSTDPESIFLIVKVNIIILDQNDNAPLFPVSSTAITISETSPPGTEHSLRLAEDLDSPKYGIKQYVLHADTDKFKLHIIRNDEEVSSVQLVIQEKLDRETTEFYKLLLVAKDGGTPPLTGTLVVDIIVLDVNDNGPQFNSSKYVFHVKEDVKVNTVVGRVWAKDLDADTNGKITYGFIEKTRKNFGDQFGIAHDTGEISILRNLDYESRTTYQLFVNAKDHGAAPIVDLTKVIVHVEDVNDHAPSIKVSTVLGGNQAQINENQDPGRFVAHVLFSDPDQGRNGEYSCHLNSQYFSLRPIFENEYDITTLQPFDRETQWSYNITLQCRDEGTPQLHSFETITVTVVDENDNEPQFIRTPYTARLHENNYVGQHITRVEARDKDAEQNGFISYTISEEYSEWVAIDQQSGVITAKAIFDYEQIQVLSFPVVAQDHGHPSKSSSTNVTLCIRDTNDERPRFSRQKYAFGLEENLPPGTLVGVVSATDQDTEAFNKVTFSLENDPTIVKAFSIDAVNGEIRSKMSLDREEQSAYHLTVLAKDSGSPSLSSSASAMIFLADANDNSPVIDFPTPFNHTVVVSADIPLEHEILQVLAHDNDVGSKAKLQYRFHKDSQGYPFGIDAWSGKIYLTEKIDLKKKREKYKLTVIVQDCGQTPNVVQASLTIILDKDIQFVPSAQATVKSRFSSRNILILVGVSSLCVITILLLAIVLVYLKRKDQAYLARNYGYGDPDRVSKKTWNLHAYLETVGQLSPDEEMDGWKYASIASSLGRSKDNFGVVQRQHIVRPPIEDNTEPLISMHYTHVMQEALGTPTGFEPVTAGNTPYLTHDQQHIVQSPDEEDNTTLYRNA